MSKHRDSNVPRAVDEICDEFETRWSQGQTPSIESFLDRVTADEQSELIHQLVALEIEFAIRNQIPEPARLEDYLQRFPNRISVEAIIDLAVREYRYRQQWADRPRLYEYTSRFPDIADKIEPPMRQYATYLTPTTVGVYRSREVAFEMRIEERVLVGRQEASDPAPFGVTREGECDRLVITDAFDREISRRAALIEIVAKGRVDIVNLGRSPLAVEMEGVIATNQRLTVERPAVVLFSNSLSLRVTPTAKIV